MEETIMNELLQKAKIAHTMSKVELRSIILYCDEKIKNKESKMDSLTTPEKFIMMERIDDIRRVRLVFSRFYNKR